MLFRKIKNIKALEHNLKLLKIAYNLKLAGSKDIESVLKELGCNKKQDNEVKNFIINNETKLAIMLAEYDNLTKHTEQKVNFLDQVAKVEQALGYPLDLEKITVKRWCSIVNNLNKSENGRENTDNRRKRIQTT